MALFGTKETPAETLASTVKPSTPATTVKTETAQAKAEKKAKVEKEVKSLLSAAAQAAKAKADAAQKEYDELIAREKSDALKQIKGLIKTHGIEQKDLFPAGEAKTKVVKYRKDGVEWSGKGKAPAVFQNMNKQQLEQYLTPEAKAHATAKA